MTQEDMFVEDSVLVQDIDQFAAILTDWHQKKVATLQHMLKLPEGTSVAINDGEEVALTPEMLDGFKLGIELSLMELGTLPFFSEIHNAH